MSENERSLEHASLLTIGDSKFGSGSDKEESVEPEENGKVSVFITSLFLQKGRSVANHYLMVGHT